MVGGVIDVDQGWSTQRLDLEPLMAGHAVELAPLLDDVTLHEFTGGAPLSAATLAARVSLAGGYPADDPAAQARPSLMKARVSSSK